MTAEGEKEPGQPPVEAGAGGEPPDQPPAQRLAAGLTDPEINAISDAVSRGVTDGLRELRGSRRTRRWPVVVAWAFVALVLVVAVTLGVVGFWFRPPQRAALSAELEPGTRLVVEASSSVLDASIARAGGIRLLQGAGTRAELVVALGEEGCHAVADWYEVQCEPGRRIDVSNQSIGVAFASPASIALTVDHGTQPADHGTHKLAVQVGQRSTGDEFAPVSLTVTTEPEAVDAFVARVIPGEVQLTFELLVGADEGARWKEREPIAATSSRDVTTTITLTTRKSSFTDTPAAASITLRDPADLQLRMMAESLRVQDSPDVVLATGPNTASLGRGESIEMDFDSPTSVRMTTERISMNTRECPDAGSPWAGGEHPCVTTSIRNDVVETLPIWFSLWPTWAQQLLTGVLVGLGLPAAIAGLKRAQFWLSQGGSPR